MKNSKIFRGIGRFGIVALALIALFNLSSCYEGRPGRDGQAYIALTWLDDEPSYIDPGTSSIPAYFQWGRFYRATPGIYNLYYEGQIPVAYGVAHYAWEMDYELYEIAGERPCMYIDGEDGPDTYFTLECSPFGPYYMDETEFKSAVEKEGYALIEASEDEIVLQKESDAYGIRISVRKVNPRN
jgi:hypothetical protein